MAAPLHNTRERPVSRPRTRTPSRVWRMAAGSSPAQLKVKLFALTARAVVVTLGDVPPKRVQASWSSRQGPISR